MAFKQTPGRSPFLKTGRGIPSPLLGLTKAQRELKKSMKDLVRQGASQIEVVDGKAVATKGGGTGLDRFSRRGIRQYIKGKDMKNTMNTRKDVIGENKVTTTPIYHEGDHKHPHTKVELNTRKEALDAAKLEKLDDSGRTFTKVEGSDFETRTPIDGGTQITRGYSEHSPGRKVEKLAKTSDYHQSLMPEFTKLKGNLPPGVTNITEYGKWKAKKAGYTPETRVKTNTSIERDLIKPQKLDPVMFDVKPVGLPDLQSIPKKVTGTPDTTPPTKDVVDLGRLKKKDKPEKIKPEKPDLIKPVKKKREKPIREKKEKPSRGQRLVEKGLSKGGVCPPCDC